MHHFANDTSLMNCNISVKKKTNKTQANHDFKNLSNYQNANKIYLTSSETEVVSVKLFKKELLQTETPLEETTLKI